MVNKDIISHSEIEQTVLRHLPRAMVVIFPPHFAKIIARSIAVVMAQKVSGGDLPKASSYAATIQPLLANVVRKKLKVGDLILDPKQYASKIAGEVYNYLHMENRF